jgi:polyisoprenoid-binding protein YceI
MKIQIINRLGSILVVCFLYFPVVSSQNAIKFLPDSSTIQIKGTSNLHEWEEKVQKFNVILAFSYNNKEIKGIDKVQFSCSSASVEGESSIMNGKTHDALKVEKFPDIKYTMTEVESFQNNNGKISGSINGDLMLAGVTKKLNLTFTGTILSNRIILKGSKQINMTDFKIDPPTAMLGTLKTGDTVELIYSLQFKTE